MNYQYFTPIIAIDGHAGAGKSTVSKAVAKHLGFWHINTGLFYRAVTWYTLTHQLDINDPAAIAKAITPLQFQIKLNQEGHQDMYLDQDMITLALRAPEINKNISLISSYAPVRDIVNQWLRAIQHDGGIIMDGRDIGTVVAPKAPLKIFLTASVAERARRCLLDIQSRGETFDLSRLEEAIATRDQKDSTRTVAPLKQAIDAVLVDSTDLDQNEVISQIIALWEQRVKCLDAV